MWRRWFLPSQRGSVPFMGAAYPGLTSRAIIWSPSGADTRWHKWALESSPPDFHRKCAFSSAWESSDVTDDLACPFRERKYLVIGGSSQLFVEKAGGGGTGKSTVAVVGTSGGEGSEPDARWLHRKVANSDG